MIMLLISNGNALRIFARSRVFRYTTEIADGGESKVLLHYLPAIFTLFTFDLGFCGCIITD